jgi:hypothetical protein
LWIATILRVIHVSSQVSWHTEFIDLTDVH